MKYISETQKHYENESKKDFQKVSFIQRKYNN
jgi:hypothetical protein